MPAKKLGCFLSVLLLFSIFTYTVDALSNRTVSLRGAGVTIDLTFPEEAHPNTTITHEVKITAYNNLGSLDIEIFIYAPVNSTLQLIESQPYILGTMNENASITSGIIIPLPEQADGTLYCNMTVQTQAGMTSHEAFYALYTTRVSTLTFSEIQSLYNEMLANYTELEANYTTLLNDYNNLLADYNNSLADYTTLLSQYDTLSDNYNDKVTAYQTLLDNFNKLSERYDTLDSNYRSQLNKHNALQGDYDLLNSTFYNIQGKYTFLQGNFTDLQAVYDALKETSNDLLTERNNLRSAAGIDHIVMFIFIVTVACLIAFIIYIKRKQPEPYVVIRKETVAMKPDEKT